MTDVLSGDTIFRLVEIASILGGGGIAVWQIGRVGGRLETSNVLQGERLKALETEIKTLNQVMTRVAVQNQRIDTQDRRLDEHTRIIEDLRRGEGMILPLSDAFKGRGRGPA